MKFTSLIAAAAVVLATALPSFAQTAAAVLMVEDNEVTEEIGLATYLPFLTEAGAYKKVWKLSGRTRSNERLAAAIRAAAREHTWVDVIVSVHTTERPTAQMLRLIPADARKLRLVYSTACYGADVEREAWEALGAKTVVTHVGINNPLVSLPYFLSRWIQGFPVKQTIEEGYREEAITSRFLVSLPGVGEAMNELYGDGGAEPAFFKGSRPVLSGLENLRITSGLAASTRLKKPSHLVYSRRSGASTGLALRALAGRYELKSDRLASVLARLGVPETPFLPPSQLREVKVVPVYSNPMHDPHDRWSRPAPLLVAGKLVVKLASEQRIPLEQGFELRVAKTVTIQPGRVDPESRTLRLETTGIWVAKGLLRYRVTSLTVKPDGDSYQVTVGGGAWGVIPYWHSLPIGGTRPARVPRDLSILSAREHVATDGIAGAIGRAPTQR